jgi:DNA repair exonuclease SbcCD ATPase subunit
MKILKAMITNFKNLTAVTIESNGRHVFLRAMNGGGKTAVLEALQTALCGKKGLPSGAVRLGEDKAQIQIELGDDAGTRLNVKTVAKAEGDCRVVIEQINAFGTAMQIKQPLTFLESLISPISLNPQALGEKGGIDEKELVEKLFPDMRAKLVANDAQYEEFQRERSVTLAAINRGKVELDKVPLIPGVPEVEVEASELTRKLDDAAVHNRKLHILQNAEAQAERDIESAREQARSSQRRIDDIEAQIATLYASLKKERAELKEIGDKGVASIAARNSIQEDIAAFITMDTAAITEEINGIADLNKKVHQNRRNREIAHALVGLDIKSSSLLRDMKATQEQRLQILKSYEMPIPGLELNESGELIYPDPHTQQMVKLSQLSTGQRWRVLASILVTQNPGLRVMMVNDWNSLDDPNREAMLKFADDNGLQLWIHETLRSGEMEIVVCDHNPEIPVTF